jgi:hypothetical protein
LPQATLASATPTEAGLATDAEGTSAEPDPVDNLLDSLTVADVTALSALVAAGDVQALTDAIMALARPALDQIITAASQQELRE